jgi:hypothetical protein
MAEQQLNGPHVGAGFEQMDGERVPQAVWRKGLANLAAVLRATAGAFDGLPGDWDIGPPPGQ